LMASTWRRVWLISSGSCVQAQFLWLLNGCIFVTIDA